MLKSILYFLIPDPTDFPSGGNLYNQQLMQALSAEGMEVQHIESKDLSNFSEFQPNSFLLVDTLYLDQISHFAVKQSNLTKILIVHHLDSLYPPSGWTSEAYFRQFEEKLLVLFDAWLCTSEYTKQYLISRKLITKRFIVIPPAIGFNPTPIQQGKGKEKIKALLVANLVERKGILPFLKALVKVQKERWSDKLQITIIGNIILEPVYANECFGLLQTNPELNKIVALKGPLSHEETLAAYPKADFFISTSFMETFGMAIQEALAFGLPVLALKGGNVEQHLQRGNRGIVFENMTDLVEQLKQICIAPHELMKGKQIQFMEKKDWSMAARDLLKQLNL